MDHQTFLNLPSEEVARLVHCAGTSTCVFPINGTRRWFMLEHMPEDQDNFWPTYMDTLGKRHVELYRMMFDHGITYLLSPIFGPDILDRDDSYVIEMALPGMERLVSHPEFLDFYDEYEIRVHFYGDHRKYLKPELSDLLDSVTERTRHHKRRFLFYGTFANDATETVAEMSIQYYNQYGKTPDKRTLIEKYYGEQVPPVNLFIGFSKFSAFDMPLVATGNEDLYFTISPTPYLTERSLRDILYDHLYSRPGEEDDYETLTQVERENMRAFYRTNTETTLGIGEKHERWRFWIPISTAPGNIGSDT